MCEIGQSVIHSGGESSFSHGPGLAINPPSLLSLAVIDASVPTKYMVRRGENVGAKIAHALVELGVVQEKHWTGAWRSEGELINAGMQEWITSLHAGLSYAPSVVLIDGDDYLPDAFSGCDFGENEAPDAFLMVCGTGEYKTGYMAEVVTEIEESVPGLGQSFLWHLDMLMWVALHGFTPEMTLELCSRFFWMGEEDESEILEEVDDGDDVDVYRKAEYLKTTPLWACQPSPKAISDTEIIALSKREGVVGKAASLIVDAQQAISVTEQSGYVTCPDECYEKSMLLRWAPNDDMLRVLDDIDHYGGYDERTDVYGIIPIKANRDGVEKMLGTLTQIRMNCALVEAMASFATRQFEPK